MISRKPYRNRISTLLINAGNDYCEIKKTSKLTEKLSVKLRTWEPMVSHQ